MKTLKKFEVNKIAKSNLSFVYGGEWVKSESTTSTDANNCVSVTTESFDDTNGDGKHSKGESSMSCTTTQCQ